MAVLKSAIAPHPPKPTPNPIYHIGCQGSLSLATVLPSYRGPQESLTTGCSHH